MMKKLLFVLVLGLLVHLESSAQKTEIATPVFTNAAEVNPVGALDLENLDLPEVKEKIFNPKRSGINNVVPGKGFPKIEDQALQKNMGKIPSKAPILNFEAAITGSTPSDPTGAVGRNHYVNAWNSAFAIWDKNGNNLVPASSLSSIGGAFTNEVDGDPIVLYDEPADRFVIMQFSAENDPPQSVSSSREAALLFAVSQGPDPVNDGWYTYRFNIESLPDYPKISLWSDGYYITTNKNARSPQGREVLFVVERDKMLQGDLARIVGFPLPGIRNNGFYSPAGFSVMGNTLPPRGNAPIAYFQDDAWVGVSQDHLKLWTVNVDWNNLSNSTIAESQELVDGVSPFNSVFDGGSFQNLSQPLDAPDIDALQGALMYMTQYRRFSGYNSTVMNFVVDVDPTPAEHAGIRWYELRQAGDGQPWQVYQEGTYAPDESDRFSGSIGMDSRGNIALGFTILNDNPVNPIYPSVKYTGRFKSDPPGVMTLEEQYLVEGVSPQSSPSGRYGDYAHLSIDPVDDLTFWHNAEHFEGVDRINSVGVFKVGSNEANDLGIVEILSPENATLSASEAITVNIRNFGTNAQSNFQVSYQIDEGPIVNETYTETILPESSAEYTFNQPADLSEQGTTYTITVFTDLNTDANAENDSLTQEVINLYPRDIGVVNINEPSTAEGLSATETINISIENFGGEPQSGFPVSYQINNNPRVTEIFTGTLAVGDSESFSFSKTADLTATGAYRITSATFLENDRDSTNDSSTKTVANLDCIPKGSDCSYGDGIFYFELGEIVNDNIPCTNGYIDYSESSAEIDRSGGNYTVTVQTLYADEDSSRMSMWIDFDDDAVFEDSERVITSALIPEAGRNYSFDFEIPEAAFLGQHLLRIRAGDTRYDGDVNDPCSVMEFGTTHDYSVIINDSNLDIEDFILEEAQLAVVKGENDTYRVALETTFNEPLRLTLHNTLGQKLLENEIRNDSGTAYIYDLDMSYAAPGVYLLRVGTRNYGKVIRFVVY